MAGGHQRMFQSADDQAAHQTGIFEAHFGFGGVDVDVEFLGREVEVERESVVGGRCL